MRVKFQAVIVLASVACASAAYAQAPYPSTTAVAGEGYAEVVGQGAFGNVSSSSFGGEIGVTIRSAVQLFVEAGYVRDTAPATLSASAQTIATSLSAIAGTTTFEVKQPVSFGIAGLKFVIPVSGGKVQPYVLGGGGVARVKKDVSFSAASGDVNQFVTLGDDLSGSETKGMISVGAGLGVPLGRAWIIDLQYRYGRVFASEAFTINRAGIGIGLRF